MMKRTTGNLLISKRKWKKAYSQYLCGRLEVMTCKCKLICRCKVQWNSIIDAPVHLVKGQWIVDRIPPDRFFSPGIELVFQYHNY